MKTKIELYCESIVDLEGSVQSIDCFIENLKNRKEIYESEGYTNISISFKERFGYYDDRWYDIVYYGDIDETKKKRRKRKKI